MPILKSIQISDIRQQTTKNKSANCLLSTFSSKKGFTLIELLVSISILAILSVAGFSTYNQSQIVARDTRRKQDLRSIANGLELYYQTNKAYPSSGNVWISSSDAGWSTLGSNLAPTYINTFPTDPKRNDGQPYHSDNDHYGYAYFSNSYACGTTPNTVWPAGSFYALVAQLENKNDPERIGNKPAKWCDSLLLPSSTYQWSPSAYVITAQ